MSTLLEQWRDTAYSKEMDKASLQKFWGTYFQTEKEIYEKLLENPDEEVKGTVKELAEKYGANVEAELGSMGKREFGSGKPGEEDDQKIYTDPDMAKEFVEQTGIDALACSFGTTHGIYLTEPKLNFDIVSGVREKTEGVPVVMHGGSGVSKEDFHKAIKAGVRKINYFTYMDKAGGTATEEYVESVEKGKPVFYSSARAAAFAAMKENVKEAIKTFSMIDYQFTTMIH